MRAIVVKRIVDLIVTDVVWRAGVGVAARGIEPLRASIHNLVMHGQTREEHLQMLEDELERHWKENR